MDNMRTAQIEDILTAKDLIFISRTKRDGSGVVEVDEERKKYLQELNEEYVINPLSLSNKTYIASGFNSYVVKLTDECRNRLNIR